MIAVLSGRFNATQRRWSVVDREGFAVVEALRRLGHLAVTHGDLTLAVDSKTISYIYNPERVVPPPSKSSLPRVYRWAISLSPYRFRVLHVDGSDNVVADLLSRAAVPTAASAAAVCLGAKSLASSMAPDDGVASCCCTYATTTCASIDWRVAVESDADFAPPSPAVVRAAQREAMGAAYGDVNINYDSLDLKLDEAKDLYVDSDGRIFVPKLHDLRERCLLLAHGSIGGHRSARTTLQRLQQLVVWPDLKDDVNGFIQRCLTCRSTDGKISYQRPLGVSLRGSKPGEVLTWDFLTLPDVDDGQGKYVLLVVDAFTGYAKAYRTKDTKAYAAVDSLLDYISMFGVPSTVSSDGGPHFIATVLANLCTELGIHKHIVVSHSPWAVGIVERLNRELIRVLTKLRQDYKLPVSQWYRVLPTAMFALNNTPSRTRGSHAPVQLFLGRPPQDGLSLVLDKDGLSDPQVDLRSDGHKPAFA